MTSTAGDVVIAEPPRPRRGRWLAAAIVAALAVVSLAAIKVTHVTLSGAGVASESTAGRHGVGLSISFSMHNGGPVPVTVLSVALAQQDSADVVAVLGPVGVASPSSGQMVPFHPVALGPGNTVDAELTERLTCPGTRDHGNASLTEVVGPVIVRFRVLGVTRSQTLIPASQLPWSCP